LGSSVTPPKPAPKNDGLLWAVRIAALPGPVIVWVFAITWAPEVTKAMNSLACGPPNGSAMDKLRIAGILLAMVAPVPAYFEILWSLAGAEPKRGLTLAKYIGLLAFVASGGFLAFVASAYTMQPRGEDWGALGIYMIFEQIMALLGIPLIQGLSSRLPFELLGFFALSQLLLLVLASAAHWSLGRDRDGNGAWAGRVKAVGYLALFLLLMNQGMHLLYRPALRDAQVVRILELIHRIHRAESTYSAIFSPGYSDTLAALGPPPSGTPASASAAGLIGNHLAGGKAEGYSYEYRGPINPGERFQKQGYEIGARPAADCQGPCYCTFTTNQTGWIWGTSDPQNPFAARLEEPPERTPPPEANSVRIIVETSPNAAVYLDNVLRGLASSEGRLVLENTAPGYHLLTVRHSFNNPFEQRILVEAGKDVTDEAKLTEQ